MTQFLNKQYSVKCLTKHSFKILFFATSFILYSCVLSYTANATNTANTNKNLKNTHHEPKHHESKHHESKHHEIKHHDTNQNLKKSYNPTALFNNMYVGFDAGVGIPTRMNYNANEPGIYFNKSFAPAPIFSLKIGKYINQNIRFDFNIMYLYKAKFKSDKILYVSEIDTLLENDYLNNVDHNVSSVSGILNGYFDFTGNTKIKPYFIGGLGASYNTTSDFTSKFTYQNTITDIKKFGKSKLSFAYNIGGGISYDIATNLIIDCSYKFINFGKITTQDKWSSAIIDSTSKPLSGILNAHVFAVGLRYSF